MLFIDFFLIMGFKCPNARVAELVYAHDLKSCLARDVGSTPTSGTRFFKKECAHNSAGRVAPS